MIITGNQSPNFFAAKYLHHLFCLLAARLSQEGAKRRAEHALV
jgi:hypothetical protein